MENKEKTKEEEIVVEEAEEEDAALEAAIIKASEQILAKSETALKSESAELKEMTESEEVLESEEILEAETTAESEATEPEKAKKGIKITKNVKIAIGGIFALLVIAYFAVAMYYSDRFLMGTTINGVQCAGKTVEEVESDMQESVEKYVLTILEENSVTEQIAGTDIGIQYTGTDAIQKALEEQNSYAWIAALFNKKEVDAEIAFSYDAEKLDTVIAGLECLKTENQTAAVNAMPVYHEESGVFEIQEEVLGTQVNAEQLKTTIHNSVALMETEVDLRENDCYIAPKFTKDSAEVAAARDELNKYLSANITYSLDSIVVNVDKSMILQWISVDENMNPVISETAVREFTDTLGDKYNTPDRAQQITTPTGKKANVSGAILGRIVGSAAECEQLISEIKEGKTVTRQPILSQEATPEGQYSWGSTYTEVDISAQHMWHIVDGNVVFECDIVTGSPGRDTPAGVFKILEKKRNKTLVGNIVPETGKPEYETPVSYWARITWSGVGFHDATWQSAFGGTRYKDGYGSHGCINMPLSDVAVYYDLIYVGCPVIVHY